LKKKKTTIAKSHQLELSQLDERLKKKKMANEENTFHEKLSKANELMSQELFKQSAKFKSEIQEITVALEKSNLH